MNHAWWMGAAAAWMAAAPCTTAQGQDAGTSDAAEAAPPSEAAALETPRGGDGWGELVRFTAFWENDGTVPRPNSGSDKHYTNGLKFDFAWQPEWADRWLEWMPLSHQFGDAPETAFGLSVGQLIFTPEDIESHEIDPDDRPYAGWLGVFAYWQRSGELSDHMAMSDHIEIDGGVVGPWSGSQALQEFIHSAWPDEVEPVGWSNQIPNYPAVDLTVRRRWRFSTEENSDGVSLQCIPAVGCTVGTVYRQVEASALVRVGWNLPDDFGPTRLADVNAATGGWNDNFGFYLYGRAGGRAVQHNIFLDGPDWKDAPQTVDSEPFVGELTVGAVLLLWRNFEIGYAQTFITEEFDTQDGPDAYGSITLGYRASF